MSALQKEIMSRRMPPVPPNTGQSGQQKGSKNFSRSRSDYSPVNWNKYFDEKRDIQINGDSFRVYLKGFDDMESEDTIVPLLVLLHGGGYSGLTFGLFAQEVHDLCKCRIVAFDLRGHGNTHTSNDEDLSATTLTDDIFRVITELFPIESLPPIVLMGHSMGGAIAVHCASTLHELMPRIVGLIVIDVVEGTALDALHSMQSFLRSRPSRFPTLENAVEWCIRSGQTRNVEAARLSMPGQLKNIATGLTATSELEADSETHPLITTQETNEIILGFDALKEEEENEDNDSLNDLSPTSEQTFKTPNQTGYTWRTDLFRSEPYWNEWFQDLSNMFLCCRADAKLLLLAGIDRLDRPLTVGQMQGKFQMQVLPKCGHTVHEDVPDKVAQVVASFLIRNRFTQPKKEFEKPFPSC